MKTIKSLAWQREYLCQWEDTRWQKRGACCNYTHRSSKIELPARILNIEYAHGRGRAWCEIMDVTGRIRKRWMDLYELHQSPNDGTQRPGTPDGPLATETQKPGSLK